MRNSRLFQPRDIIPTIRKVQWRPSMHLNLPSSYIDNSETDFYHSQIKPLLYVLRWMGVLPIEIRRYGTPRFCLLSPAVAYSVIVYVLVMASVYCSLKDRMSAAHRRINFDYKIYNALHTFTSGGYTLIPIAIAADVKKFIQYTNEWVMLQTLFHKVTGQRLVPSVRKQSVCYAVFCILTGMGNILFHFHEPFISIWALPSHIFSTTLWEIIVIYWLVTFHCLIIAGSSFSTCFKTNLEQGNVSAETIGEYRILWLRLSELISSTGVATQTLMAFFMSWLLFGLVMCLYALLFGINSGYSSRVIVVTTVGLMLLLSVVQFYSMCSKADCIRSIAGSEVQKQLQLVSTWGTRQDVQQEVNKFLLTISMNAPVISVMGFTNLNRRLFASYASAMLTYLIVLLQMKM